MQDGLEDVEVTRNCPTAESLGLNALNPTVLS